MYCKCGDMGSGRKVFYGSMERNAISWTALMSGYVSNGRPEQALRSIVWMQQEGSRPDVVTVATIVPVCTELRALDQGKEIHAYVVKNYFLDNISIVSSLMMMYRNPSKATQAIQNSPKITRHYSISNVLYITTSRITSTALAITSIALASITLTNESTALPKMSIELTMTCITQGIPLTGTMPVVTICIAQARGVRRSGTPCTLMP